MRLMEGLIDQLCAVRVHRADVSVSKPQQVCIYSTKRHTRLREPCDYKMAQWLMKEGYSPTASFLTSLSEAGQ